MSANIQAYTDGYVYKSGTATSSESTKFQRLTVIANQASNNYDITLHLREVQVLFSMTKNSTIDYNQPYVWSLQVGNINQISSISETPLNHNFQPNMADSNIVAVGLGNINGNKYELHNAKIILPPGKALFFVIEPEDKTTGVTYYTEINVVYDNSWWD